MKRDKFKFILPAIFICLLVLVLIFKPAKLRKNKGSSKLLFPVLRKSKIVTLKITKKSNTIINICKADDRWRLKTSAWIPVSFKKVKSALELVRKFRREYPVTENTNKHMLYEVDTINGQLVEFISERNESISFIMGKHGPGYTSTFIRKKGEKMVYRIDEYLPDVFDIRNSSWIDMDIFQISVNDVTTFTIISTNDTINFGKVKNKWEISDMKNEKLNSSIISDTLEELLRLKVLSYITNTEKLKELKNAFEKPLCKFIVTYGKKNNTAELWGIRKNNNYICKRAKYIDIYTISLQFIENLLKERQEYLTIPVQNSTNT